MHHYVANASLYCLVYLRYDVTNFYAHENFRYGLPVPCCATLCTFLAHALMHRAIRPFLFIGSYNGILGSSHYANA